MEFYVGDLSRIELMGIKREDVRQSNDKKKGIIHKELVSETDYLTVYDDSSSEFKELIESEFIEEVRIVGPEVHRLLLADELTEEQKEWYLNSVIEWEPGKRYIRRELVRFGEDVYRVIITHSSQSDYRPDQVPNLFVKVPQKTVKEGIEVIPNFVQPTSVSYYTLGDKVRYKGKIYESLLAVNTWSPEEYANGWKLIN